MPTWDAIVVGGGHNGLTAAAYLARAGRRVLVLERRTELGGAAISARVFDGVDARLSRYSYLVSLLPQAIVDELGLGVRLADRAVAACAPSDRGTLLVEQHAGSPATRASFAAVTGDDRAWEAFCAWNVEVDAAAARFWPTVTEPLPSRVRARELLGDALWRSLVERPLGEVLEERFPDPLVRGMVATDGLIGTFAALDEPSLVQNRCFLYHVIGGPWRVPVGGMGAVTAELERAARAAGAELRCGADVVDVDAATGEVTWREDGTQHTATADRVLLGCAWGRRRDAEGAQLKINLLLDRLPQLRCGTPAERAFAGTYRVNESATELQTAYEQAARGDVPDAPPAELYCHTLTDRSILGAGVPPTAHTLTAFVLHAPARIFAADASAKDVLVDRVLDGLDSHLAEPIRPLIRGLEARTPQELEAELGLPGGHIFHGDLAWPWDEPRDGAPNGRWGVETEHERLLICGAGARRGGGVSGLGGRDAAMAVLDAARAGHPRRSG